MENGVILKVEALVKHFGPVKAVDGISFDVRRGECFGLLGRNGAGKSTTIKLLMGLLPYDAGHAKINGTDLAKHPYAVRQSIGYVPQSLSADGVLTGAENLSFFGKLFGLKAAQLKQRVPEVLAMLDLQEAASRPVSTYSGGMIRRLEVGQSILHRPPLLFLDEPTTGMDPVARESLWSYIRQLKNHYDISILLTTHYMQEAEQLCNRFAIMNQGKIVALGSLPELRRQAKAPRASLEDLFVRLVGSAEPETQQGDFHNVQRSRRTARRLG